MPCTMPEYGPRPSPEAEREIASLRRQVKELQQKKSSKTVLPAVKIVDDPEKDQIIHNMSVEIDRLRDLIYYMYNEDDWSEDILTEVKETLDKQVEHRNDDLSRLAKVFGQNLRKYKEHLKKVLDADPSLPLEPQLGFNPDEF